MAENGYTGNHRARAYAAKKRAGFRCENCGRPDRTVGLNRKGQPWMMYLQGAHRDHDKHNPHARYLCLCPKCHDEYDRVHREALRQLNEQMRAEMNITPFGEADLLAHHAELRAEEDAAWQAWRAVQASVEQAAALHARALWCSCKRSWFEMRVAHHCVARCRSGWQGGSGFRQLLAFHKAKQARYQAALARYQQVVGPDPALQLRAATRPSRRKESIHAATR